MTESDSVPLGVVDTASHWRPEAPRDRARERSAIAIRAHTSHLRSDVRRAGERQPGSHWASRRVCASRGARSRRRAPKQPAAATRHVRARSTRHSAPSAGAPAADRAAALWQLCCRIGHDDDGRLPGVRLTRALPPRANGHDRGAWCERRNRAASARWGPRSPDHPASRLHWHALVRAAFDKIGPDRRKLRSRRGHTRSVEH